MNTKVATILKQFSQRGVFNPFCYAIGLESTLADALDFIGTYPLPEPFELQEIENLGKSLALIHEYTHLHQYLCTCYGLRYLRMTIIALSRMMQNKPVRLPLLAHLDTNIQRDMEDQNRYLAFIEVYDQMRIHKNLVPFANAKENIISWVEHYTALFYLIPEEYRRRDLLQDANSDLTIKKLPHLLYKENGDTWDLPLTAALLMEAYAILVEINHLDNALNHHLSLSTLLEIVPQAPEYRCVIEYAYQSGVCHSGSYLPLLLCIDVALMYDPFTLYNVSVSTKPSGQVYEDVYPGDTFMRACAAAAKLEFKGYNDIESYYEQLCLAIDVPSPVVMVQKAFEIAERLDKNSAGPHALLSGAIKMHRDILEQRCKNPYLYPITLSQRIGIWDSLEYVLKQTTFFDLNTGLPMDMRYVENIDLLTVHDILFQILFNEKIKCPLKAGHPFKCMNHDTSQTTLCLWHNEKEAVGECLVDVIERFLGIAWQGIDEEENN